MNTKSLGAILRDWRIESNLSQGQLGKSAGLSRKIVGAIERGDRKIDHQHLVRLCKALDRSHEELILRWSRSFLDELQQVEREIHGPQEGAARPDEADPLVRPASGSVDEIFDGIAAQLKELYHRAQAELIHTLQLQMGPPGSSSPSPPAALQRTRSRVSRKGRVRAGND